MLTRIKAYLQRDFPVRIDAPALVSLFVYDNDTFIVQSFRDSPTLVNVSVAGEKLRLRNVLDNQILNAPTNPAEPAAPGNVSRRNPDLPRTTLPVTVEPHSYLAFKILR